MAVTGPKAPDLPRPALDDGGRRLADAYSASGRAWQGGPSRVYDRLSDVLLAHAPTPVRGRLALDVGAGTGAASRAIRRAGGIPIALDRAVGMLAVDQVGRPPATVADARHLPMATGSCGVVVAAFSYNHVTDPGRALAEGRRVLEPGGCLLASAYAADDGHPVKDAVDRAAGEVGWRPDPWVAAMREAAVPRLATVEAAHAAASAAGLDAQVLRVEVAFPELDAAQLVAWRMGMAHLAPFLSARTAAQRRDVAGRALELLGRPDVLVRRMIVIAALVD